jgi:hypothetical protein
VGAKFIKDEAGDIKVEEREREIIERWKRYFEQLLNGKLSTKLRK